MLYVVSTPIGHADDISQRALQAIESSDVIIGEERKVTCRFLKQHNLTGRTIELLNEHSDSDDIKYYLELCKSKTVALISDCGTPGFCDPGAELVDQCHQQSIPVKPIPGASSLMAFLAISGVQLQDFYFRGFLPGNNEKRKAELEKLTTIKSPIIIMDTPYRLEKTVEEMAKYFKSRSCVVGYRLTFEDEMIFKGTTTKAAETFKGLKGEFILMIL